MRHKTKAHNLGGGSILVGWLFFAPVMILWFVVKGLRKVEWK
jgi:K+ transporter